MIDAFFKEGSNWPLTELCHAFGIPALTKSRFGKNKSDEVLTPDRRFAFMTECRNVPVCTILTLDN